MLNKGSALAGIHVVVHVGGVLVVVVVDVVVLAVVVDKYYLARSLIFLRFLCKRRILFFFHFNRKQALAFLYLHP